MVRDPIKPDEPLVVRRPRPGTVTLAGVLLYASGAIGAIGALALLVGAGPVVQSFRTEATVLGVSALDSADIGGAIRTALMSSGSGAMALAALSLLLARGVLRRSEPARVGALVVAGASLGCGLVRTSVTAFGANVNWAVAAGHDDPMIVAAVSRAYDEAMPGWLAGLGGGLTDLQSLGYLAVAALLVVPASTEYFRTRILWSDRAPHD